MQFSLPDSGIVRRQQGQRVPWLHQPAFGLVVVACWRAKFETSPRQRFSLASQHFTLIHQSSLFYFAHTKCLVLRFVVRNKRKLIILGLQFLTCHKSTTPHKTTGRRYVIVSPSPTLDCETITFWENMPIAHFLVKKGVGLTERTI